MKLSIKDRLTIHLLYPTQGNILSQLQVKSIQEKVQLTEQELQSIDLKQDGTQLTWDEKKASDKEILFTESELTLLKQQVKKMDESNQVTREILDLCLKIQDYKTEEEKVEKIT